MSWVRKIILTLMSMLLLMDYTMCQQISPKVNGVGGLAFSSNGLYIDMSIGEFAVSTIQSSENIITQGFLQPISIEQPCSNPEITYYPNPVVDQMNIEAVDCDVTIEMVEVVDLFGKLALLSYPVNNIVDMSPVGVGVYILKLFNGEEQLIGSIKIVKISA